MKRQRGFTLIELLVVIIIIIILASLVVVLAGAFMRGQGVRQGAMTVVQTLARARQLSVTQRVPHFVVFTVPPAGQEQTGYMHIYRDSNNPLNSSYDGADQKADDDHVYLPRLTNWMNLSLAWVGFTPSGSAIFPSGYTEVQASAFDAAIVTPNPASPTGDLILKSPDGKFQMWIDIDRPSGRVRRHQFVQQD